jgi:hypothetical protein
MGPALKAFLAKYGEKLGPMLAKLREGAGNPIAQKAGIAGASGAAGLGAGYLMGSDDEEEQPGMDQQELLMALLKKKGLV